MNKSYRVVEMLRATLRGHDDMGFEHEVFDFDTIQEALDKMDELFESNGVRAKLYVRIE